ncbi:hypothetical protein [Deferrisoma sp.]
MSAWAERTRADLRAALEREARAARALAAALEAARSAVADPRRLDEALAGARDAVQALHRASALREAAAGRWARAGGAADDPALRRGWEDRTEALEAARAKAAALGIAARFGKTVTEHLVRQAAGTGYGPGTAPRHARAVCQA